MARHLDGLLCHAYCLMENHYHLLVETPRANLDDAMQRLNGTYAMRFNRHHERTGHVFQGRYGAKLITDDDYALTVVRYIAANPVQAGLCAAPEEWPWSSYAATAGLASAPSGSSRRRCSSWFARPRRVPAVRRRRARRGIARAPPAAAGARANQRPRADRRRPPDARLPARRDRRPSGRPSEHDLARRSPRTSQREKLGSDPVFAPVQEAGVSMHFENTPATWA